MLLLQLLPAVISQRYKVLLLLQLLQAVFYHGEAAFVPEEEYDESYSVYEEMIPESQYMGMFNAKDALYWQEYGEVESESIEFFGEISEKYKGSSESSDGTDLPVEKSKADVGGEAVENESIEESEGHTDLNPEVASTNSGQDNASIDDDIVQTPANIIQDGDIILNTEDSITSHEALELKKNFTKNTTIFDISEDSNQIMDELEYLEAEGSGLFKKVGESEFIETFDSNEHAMEKDEPRDINELDVDISTLEYEEFYKLNKLKEDKDDIEEDDTNAQKEVESNTDIPQEVSKAGFSKIHNEMNQDSSEEGATKIPEATEDYHESTNVLQSSISNDTAHETDSTEHTTQTIQQNIKTNDMKTSTYKFVFSSKGDIQQTHKTEVITLDRAIISTESISTTMNEITPQGLIEATVFSSSTIEKDQITEKDKALKELETSTTLKHKEVNRESGYHGQDIYENQQGHDDDRKPRQETEEPKKQYTNVPAGLKNIEERSNLWKIFVDLHINGSIFLDF